MIIGGFEPLSLSDYPGRVACLVFTQGCNLRCHYCHNKRLWPIFNCGGHGGTASLLDELSRRRRIVESVVVTGGEPTIQEDLPDFVEKLRGLGLRVKLDTNGTRPAMVAHLLELRAIDYIAMDIKAPLDRYEEVAGTSVDHKSILQSIGIIARSNVPHHFRTTVISGVINDDDLAAIRAMVPIGSAYRLQRYRTPR